MAWTIEQNKKSGLFTVRDSNGNIMAEEVTKEQAQHMADAPEFIEASYALRKRIWHTPPSERDR